MPPGLPLSNSTLQLPTPRWMKVVLALAAAYNLLWGFMMLCFPRLFFELAEMEMPIYLQFWQGLGMMIGLFGVGYAIAAFDPARHWPLVFIGLLGKVLNPIGFLFYAANGDFPWSIGWSLILNDLVWWVPFGLILLHARKSYWYREEVQLAQAEADREHLIQTQQSQTGKTLSELSSNKPVLVVFLRHAGCTFCRQALADLQTQRSELETAGVQLAIVHMGAEEEAQAFFKKYDLEEIPRFSDPKQRLYRSFGLGSGNLNQLFGRPVWSRGFRACLLEGHGVGKLVGDGFQMPGVFLLEAGQVKHVFRHQAASDRPNYLDFVKEASLSPAA
ncbi:Alkyl hydroperoxide reductase/ Thiol specific antioxidant/ Mal allergen [Planctomycetales bacterium 10988]|nr:Alkyl hydroperoxide reductase/ Thiol specific antioxidant/ Mal allergen [Planctomycetales bacterium 10988]